MNKLISLQQAHDSWSDLIAESNINKDDDGALHESWSEYTDSLCKDGQLTDLQYHYCPSHDDPMPTDDARFVVKCLDTGVNTADILEHIPNAILALEEDVIDYCDTPDTLEEYVAWLRSLTFVLNAGLTEDNIRDIDEMMSDLCNKLKP